MSEIKYDEAIAEIEEIITKIEGNDMGIDELSSQVKRVAVLLKKCKSKLNKTETDVEKILKEMEK